MSRKALMCKLKKARKFAKMTVEEAMKKSNVDVEMFELGVYQPSANDLKMLSKLYGVKEEYFTIPNASMR